MFSNGLTDGHGHKEVLQGSVSLSQRPIPPCFICLSHFLRAFRVLQIVKLWQASSRCGGEFEVVSQVDNTDLADGHLHVGKVVPSGVIDARHARHLLRSK